MTWYVPSVRLISVYVPSGAVVVLVQLRRPVHATVAPLIGACVSESVTVPVIVPELGVSELGPGVGLPDVTTTADPVTSWHIRCLTS